MSGNQAVLAMFPDQWGCALCSTSGNAGRSCSTCGAPRGAQPVPAPDVTPAPIPAGRRLSKVTPVPPVHVRVAVDAIHARHLPVALFLVVTVLTGIVGGLVAGALVLQ